MLNAKTIYLDGRALADPKPKGVARYTVEMLKCLADMDVDVVLISNRPYHIFPVRSARIKYEYIKYCRYIPGFVFIIFILPFILINKKNSVFWGINHAVPAFGIASVVTIHDLVAFHYSSTMTLYNSFATKFSIIFSTFFADSISTVSIKTKNELLLSKLIPRDSCIHVVSNIVDLDKFKPASNYVLRNKCILILGSMEPRKNILNAILAFNNLCNFDREWRLLVVGGKNWGVSDVFDAIDNSRYKNNIELIDHISDSSLIEMYRTVALLLFPSYDEGFGLPVFEAISCGCPVLATKHCELQYYLNEDQLSLLIDPEQGDLTTELSRAVEHIDRYAFDIKVPDKELAKSQISFLFNTAEY